MNTQPHGPVVPTPDALTTLRPLPKDAVRLDPAGLLGGWQVRNAEATLPHCAEQLDAYGNLANLRRVTGETDVPYAGMWFADTDVYKTLEALAWQGDLTPFGADVVALLEKAQDPDGYLNSYYQVDHRSEQWSDLGFSHEMYTAGHLIQAAVAAARTAGENAQAIVAVARRFADLLVSRFSAVEAYDGHPEVETALVELYRLTGHRPYLALAERFLALRGKGLLGPGRFGPRYWQDHQPLRETREVTGHAVRQVYLLAGAVDVAVETHDRELLATAERLWDDAQRTKTYVTGGQGSRHKTEAFGDAYELPPDRAYAETCAAIGSFQWAWRLLLATGHARYADEMERLLHNGIAASIAADGRSFFYANPLQLRTGHDGSHEDTPSQRLTWYSCACCPPNLARLMASLHTYAATGTEHGLQLHLYAPGTFRAGAQVVDVTTGYPWNGVVTVTVREAGPESWTLALRVPAWCDDARLTVNGALVRAGAQEGNLRVNRVWRPGDVAELTLAMPARVITPDPRVDAVRGTVALARGPVVYCLEHADIPAGEHFEDLELDLARAGGRLGEPAPAPDSALSGRPAPDPAEPPREEGRPVLLEGVPLRVRTTATAVTAAAVPYFLWANRGPGPMRVWIPLVPREE